MRNPVEDKFSSYKDETDLDNIITFANSISHGFWLTVTAKNPENLETYLHLKSDKTVKVDYETLKYEQRHNKLFPLFSKLFHHNTNMTITRISSRCL